jgi:hypothetical protein
MNKTDLYRWFDETGQLLYVGISISAYERAKDHRKTKEWFREAKKMTIEQFATREQALEAEKTAIQNEKPLHNVVHSTNGQLTRTFNIAEAAKATGKSQMTIRKYLGLSGRPSRLPNAQKVLKAGDFQETWQIPESDLWQSGLMTANEEQTYQTNHVPNETKIMQDVIQLQSQIINKLIQLQRL